MGEKKRLLEDWEIVQQEYYLQFNRSAVSRLYIEWFDDDDQPLYMNKDEMINELMESELDCRRDDSIEEIKETIEHVKTLINK
tara:strand:- start:21 stop:269 length:249 start_codon:yes stop_codon:yes gene_type:complete